MSSEPSPIVAAPVSEEEESHIIEYVDHIPVDAVAEAEQFTVPNPMIFLPMPSRIHIAQQMLEAKESRMERLASSKDFDGTSSSSASKVYMILPDGDMIIGMQPQSTHEQTMMHEQAMTGSMQ
jgi:hypothetical protein